MRIFTVGHSNQPIDSFINLLRRHNIRQVADVRRYPSSRRWPQFNGGALARSLKEAAVAYRHFEDLGGKRSSGPESKQHPGLDSAWKRDYAAYMNTQVYRDALGDLVEWAREHSTAVMCAEASPDHCHRNLLSDALTHRDHEVVHILAEGSKTHRLHAAVRVDNGVLLYDQGVLPLDF